ncbi:MAG: tetratricopeptide repeat protein [Blastocatellia bacterium]|nr:tetratricopeptide repeat protein [Blastocatellia bacterium]
MKTHMQKVGRAAGIAILLAALSLLALAQTERDLAEGRRLLAEGRFAEAVAAFNRHKQANPADARAYFHAGVALAEAGRLSDAALELGEAIRLDSRRPEYRVFQASVLVRLKQNPAALDALSALTASKATEGLDVAWLWLLSDVYYRLEKFDDALRILDLLETRAPGDARLDLNRGQAYAVKAEYDRARQSLQRSVAKFPANPLAHFELGKLLYQLNEMAAAAASLREAVRLDPENPQYLHKLGAALIALNQPDEAIAALERAVAHAAEFPKIYYALGQAWQRKGDRARAGEFMVRFKRAREAQEGREGRESEVSRLIAKGERMLDEGNSKAALSFFEQAAAEDPGNWTARAYLAEEALAAGDAARAHPHLLRMEEIDPESPVGNYLMARHWAMRGEFEKARGYAERVRQARPAHAELRNLLGTIYLGLGRKDEAMRELAEAIRLAPDRADFRENLQRLKSMK